MPAEKENLGLRLLKKSRKGILRLFSAAPR